MFVRPPSVRNRAAALVVALVLSVGVIAPTARLGAAPPTDDPVAASEYGAGWLAAQIQPDGSLPGGFDPLGDAGNAALSLAASGVGGDAFDRAVGHVEANLDAFVAYPFDPTIDDPGRLAKAIMLADLSGADPTNFGGSDLIARLQATFGALEPGLYGANDPSFDGVFRQGLAITALNGAGRAVPVEAVDWLLDQQCDAPAASAGGWEDYRADPTLACDPPDPSTFTGPDTNSTALAIMALEATGTSYPSPEGFLEGAQEDDGGWPFIPGTGTDPSSTSLIIRALVARGDDPSAWTRPGGDPWSALLSFQQGCSSPVADRGAFTSTFADPPGTPDVLSTIDGVAGATAEPYPLGAPVSLTPSAPEVDCSPGGSTTTTTGPGGGSNPDGPTGPGGPSFGGTATPVATAVAGDPRFTG